MLTEQKTKRIEDQLNGTSQDFLQEVADYGYNKAIKDFHLESINFSDLFDWAEPKLERKGMSQRGTFHNPDDSRYTLAEDLVTMFIRELTWRDARIAELEEEIAQRALRDKYLRSQDSLRRAISKFGDVVDGHKH
jgi:hypothetical protein